MRIKIIPDFNFIDRYIDAGPGCNLKNNNKADTVYQQSSDTSEGIQKLSWLKTKKPEIAPRLTNNHHYY